MPQQDLQVSLIQQSLVWQDGEANRQRFAKLIREQESPADLVVLPEMFTAGFSMETQHVAEAADGPTLAWMKSLAAESGAVITGSYAVRDEANPDRPPFNRLVWMRPNGDYDCYDKRHLFRMAGEHERYQSGRDKLLVELHGWRICPMVCYDLRFPVWCRNTSEQAYDLLLFVANWPAARAYHWSQLLKARAIENLACVVGVNRVGQDGKGFDYSGDSIILDAQGLPLAEPGSAAGVFSATLSAQALNGYREKFPAHLDADAFSLE